MEERFTPLHIAVILKKRALVKHMIERGSSVNKQNEYGASPFQTAVEDGNVRMADLLLENGADINIRGWEGRTPLHWTIGMDDGYCDPRMFKYLLERGADPSVKDDFGQTISYILRNSDFEYAAGIARYLEALRYLLENHERGLDDKTAMAFSIMTGDLARVKKLLGRLGADAELEYYDEGKAYEVPIFNSTLLTMAVSRKQLRIAEFLLDSGADVNKPDYMGAPIVHTVSDSQAALRILKMLIARGAFVDAVSKEDRGATTLMIAAGCGYVKAARILLDAGADPTIKDEDGRDALAEAEKNGHAEIASMIKDSIEKKKPVDGA